MASRWLLRNAADYEVDKAAMNLAEAHIKYLAIKMWAANDDNLLGSWAAKAQLPFLQVGIDNAQKAYALEVKRWADELKQNATSVTIVNPQ